MATVSKWTPFGVALDVTATGGSVVRKSATQFTVVINASWETYYSGALTNYGMTAASGGVTHTISAFNGTKRSSGSGTFTGTYSISGNGAATKSITVTFRNFNTDNGDSATKSVSFNVSVPAWTSYKVTYNANGGSGAPGSQTKWKDQALTLSSTKPTRTGHSFQGWATSKTGGVAYAAGGKYTANAAVTLYAVWKANTYAVKYNANGGTGAPSSQTKTYGVTLKLSSIIPTRNRYRFRGWSTSASATTATYSAGGNYTNNSAVTLYAVWELAYVKPSISNLTVNRCDQAGNLTDEGDYARISFKWKTTEANPLIEIRVGNTILEELAGTGTSGSVDRTLTAIFSTDITYTLTVKVTDSIDNFKASVLLNGTAFPIDVLAKGKGVSFGKPAELTNVCDIAYQTRHLGGILQPVLEAGVDFNNVKTPNTYSLKQTSTNSYLNCPFSTGSGTLEVIAAGDTGQLHQIATFCSKNQMSRYERFFYTNAWGSWFETVYDSGWKTPTLSSDFVLYATDSNSAVKYRRINKMVEVRGVVKPTSSIGGSTDNYTIFELPVGFRPSSQVSLVMQGSGHYSWLFSVTSAGVVRFSRYGAGDTFHNADTGTWLPFQATFFVD